MEEFILYTYNNQYFKDYYEHLREQNTKIFSFSRVDTGMDIERLIDDDEEFYIDITSLIQLLRKNEDSIYTVEKFLYNLEDNKNVKIIIDKHYSDEALKILKHNFTFSQELDGVSKEELEINSESSIDNTIKDKTIRKICDLNLNERKDIYDEFNKKLIGHKQFKEDLVDKVEEFIIVNKIGEQNILSLFLLGQSGIGKTHVARILHQLLTKEEKLIKVNFGNYGSKDALNSLIGSPRGYMGSESGELNEKLMKSDTGIILVDEFEKADSRVFNFFLELLEDGKYTDSLGNVHDLDGYIIIFTSNLTSQNFNQIISPELRSRIDYICEFESLNYKEKQEYKEYRVKELIHKYNKYFNKEHVFKDIYKFMDIDVTKYSNIRDLNKRITKEFVEYIKDNENTIAIDTKMTI